MKYNDHKTIIADYIPDFSDNYDGSYDILGTYETEKRALEVLDEINRHIEELYNMTFTNNCGLSQFTYEMPKE